MRQGGVWGKCALSRPLMSPHLNANAAAGQLAVLIKLCTIPTDSHTDPRPQNHLQQSLLPLLFVAFVVGHATQLSGDAG